MTVSMYGLALDSADAAKLAGFWAEVLGRSVDDGATSDFAAIGMEDESDGSTWLFQRVPEGKTAKNRMHPDFMTADLDAEVERIVGLGAGKHAEHEEGGTRWRTLTDPEGNEFDVCSRNG
jgi:predicted enzyme related to lactoylglutathione lyase